MTFSKESLRLYAVTPDDWAPELLFPAVEKVLQGGATMIQLRRKTALDSAILAEAKTLHALCARYAVPLVLNDNLDVALASGVDGVHVGQHDVPASVARQHLGAGQILGVSVLTVAQAIQAERDGADYLGVGAVFPTATKQDAKAVSRETLTQICEAVTIPVVAIGGITAENRHFLAGTGIAGVAVVSALFGASDIYAATERFLC